MSVTFELVSIVNAFTSISYGVHIHFSWRLIQLQLGIKFGGICFEKVRVFGLENR